MIWLVHINIYIYIYIHMFFCSAMSDYHLTCHLVSYGSFLMLRLPQGHFAQEREKVAH